MYVRLPFVPPPLPVYWSCISLCILPGIPPCPSILFLQHPSTHPSIFPPPLHPSSVQARPLPLPLLSPKGLTVGKGRESPDGDVSVPERKDEVAGGGGEEEEAEERGRVGGRGGSRPAASAGPALQTPPAGGGTGRGGPARVGLGRGGRAAPPAMLTPGA